MHIYLYSNIKGNDLKKLVNKVILRGYFVSIDLSSLQFSVYAILVGELTSCFHKDSKQSQSSCNLMVGLQFFFMFCSMCHLQSSRAASGKTVSHAFTSVNSLSVIITRGCIQSPRVDFTQFNAHVQFSSFSLCRKAKHIQNVFLVEVTPTI